MGIVTKPEFWFQVFMWCCYWSAPRLPILIVCAVINIYGLCIGLFHLKPMMGTPEQLEKMLDEADPEMKSKLQKIGVVFAKPTSARAPLTHAHLQVLVFPLMALLMYARSVRSRKATSSTLTVDTLKGTGQNRPEYKFGGKVVACVTSEGISAFFKIFVPMWVISPYLRLFQIASGCCGPSHPSPQGTGLPVSGGCICICICIWCSK